tara:strand:+ start:402 stop:1115 length:714 start_codon:yes stop_codon:yes gene_type:complete
LVVVVLVEPAGPLNIGSVARLCANFGVDQLRLVNPRCDPKSRESRQMAVHAGVRLETASLHSSLESAVADCTRVVATCGRLDHGVIPLQNPDQALNWLMTGAGTVAVVFGREDRGLTNEELRICHRVLTLHSGESYPSLNLSHAVAIVLHDMARLGQNLPPEGERSPDPASPAQLSGLMEDAADLLLDCGFLLPHTREARMAKVRDLLHRASSRTEEVAMLRGMVRQLRWAMNAKRT